MLGLGTRRNAKQPLHADGDDNFRVAVMRSGTHLLIEQRDKDGELKASLVFSEANIWALVGVLLVFIGVPMPRTLGQRFKVTRLRKDTINLRPRKKATA